MSDSIAPSTNIQPKGLTGGHVILWLNRNWLFVFSLIFGLLIGLPFLAPVFMQFGWEKPARVIYLFYSLLCHQLPQRSFFLFGPESMYSLSEIQAVWRDSIDPHILRQYIGDAQLGWKVAWSDRMVWMYSSILVFGWFWRLLRRKLKPLPLWGLALFLLPMAIDGGTHLVSDISGIGQGFRDSNLWLAELTNSVFAASFYAGDGLGSFNSWMRLISGFSFGLGIAWFAFPYFEQSYKDMANILEAKFNRLETLNQTTLHELFGG